MWTWLSRAAQPIMPYLMVAALATLLGLVAVIRYQSNQLSTLQQHQGALVLSLTQTSQSYFDLKQLAADNQQAQAELRAKLAAVSSTSQYRKNKIEELKRELSDVKPGLMLSCLMLFAGCTSAPPLVAVQSTVVGCPLVIPCQLPASNPVSNQGISSEIDTCEAAWHECAAQIDMIIDCQNKQKAKANANANANANALQTEGNNHE